MEREYVVDATYQADNIRSARWHTWRDRTSSILLGDKLRRLAFCGRGARMDGQRRIICLIATALLIWGCSAGRVQKSDDLHSGHQRGVADPGVQPDSDGESPAEDTGDPTDDEPPANDSDDEPPANDPDDEPPANDSDDEPPANDPDDEPPAYDPGDRTPGDYGPLPNYEPLALFTDLGDNTAVDLGRFACQGPDSYCSAVTDYSGMTYDRRNHQLLMFGGGHASTMTDTIFSLSLDQAAPTWRQLYEPTPCSAMIPSNVNKSLGAWVAGKAGPYPRPVSAHTYDWNAFSPETNEFILLGRSFTAGHCSKAGNGVTGPVAHYSIDGGSWSFSEDKGSPVLKSGLSAGEYDPVSKTFLTVSAYGIYQYDPISRQATTLSTRPNTPTGEPFKINALGYANELVYYPPFDIFYYITRSTRWPIVALKPNRDDMKQSTMEIVETTGPRSPNGEPGYDYDMVNDIIGGGVAGDNFYAFNPRNSSWSAHRIKGGDPGSQAFHAISYDPINNVFVFITTGRRTWAYRFAAP